MNRSTILVVALLFIASNQLVAQQTVRSVEVVATLRGHTSSIQGIAFSPSGELLAASGKDGTVRLWNTVTGESLPTIVVSKNSDIYALGWSSDDRRLAITYRSQKSWTVAVWDVPPGQQPILSERVGNIYFLGWSPNGHTFLTLDTKAKLQIWDTVSRQAIHTLTPALAITDVFTVSFVAYGQRILTTAVGRPVQLWDVATGKLVDSYLANEYIPAWHYAGFDVAAVSRDGRFLISGNLNIYETDTGRLLTRITGGSSPVSISPDGKTVLTVSYDPESKFRHRQSYLSIRKIDNGDELSAFQVPEGVRYAFWSPNGKTMALVGYTFSPRLIDVASGRENGRLPYDNCWPWTLSRSDGCEPIKFSADSEVLLKEQEPIKLWDARTASLIQILTAAHLPAVFSPTEGQLLATRSEDKKSVLLWRLKR